MALLRMTAFSVTGSFDDRWNLSNIGSNRAIIGAQLQVNSIAGLVPFLDIVTGDTIRFQTTGSGQIEVQLTGGVSQYTAVDTVRAGVTYWFVIDCQVQASATIKIWLNGRQVLNVSGVNTIPLGGAVGGTYNWSGVTWPGQSAGNTTTNRYVWDDTGTTNNAPITDRPLKVTRTLMSADSSVAWTPHPGAPNYGNVNDAAGPTLSSGAPPGDGDATYNSSSNVNDVDLFTPVAVSTGDTIVAMQVTVVARQVTGTGAVAPTVKQGATTYPATDQETGPTYDSIIRPYNTLPDGTALGTDASFNALTFGYKKTA